MIANKLYLPVGLMGLALTACPSPPDPNAGRPLQVQCYDPAETKLCWSERLNSDCGGKNFSAQEICSKTLHGDLDHTQDYPDAEFSGHCVPEVGDDYPTPPCMCSYENGPPDGEACVELTEDPDPTDGVFLTTYVCSRVAADTCREVDYVDPDLKIDPNLEWCWQPPYVPPTELPCVQAYDETEALEKCESFCGKAQTDHANDLAAHNKDIDQSHGGVGKLQFETPQFECTIDGDPHVLSVWDPVNDGECFYEDAYPYLTWGGTTGLFAAQASSTFTMNGGSAGNQTILATIGYEITNCVNDICDVTIDALEGVQSDISGIFTAADGSQTTYTLADLDFSLKQTVRGRYYQARGTIVFADSPFVANVRVGSATIGGTAMGTWDQLAVVEQAVGSLRGSSLVLNLTVNLTQGVFLISFQTM
ncbi:hypothetical protein [Nannocystis pusilla]|uniref:Lipoprotein n=1 Tax=Nannocystis pusilla TaxID=889268 RepID=A0ABS7TL27_9BACT|nr:hypothetical protein [Nannocystis pusilla]MBZ5708911.1 hypothetical protein [Nannocystis pusilla]